MKSKLTITVASILSVLVLVGVGFAAWVITNPNVNANADGNIQVDTVTDNSYEIEATWGTETDITNNGKIVFGAAGTYDGTPWLTLDKQESLKAVLTLTAKSFQKESWTEISKKTLTVSMKSVKDGKNDTGFEGLVNGTNKYIAFPTLSGAGDVSKTLNSWSDTVVIKLSAFAHEDSATTATYKLTITFAWGEYFKDKDSNSIVNPYVYYNKLGYSAENATKANTDLTAIYKALNGVTYQVNIVETKG